MAPRMEVSSLQEIETETESPMPPRSNWILLARCTQFPDAYNVDIEVASRNISHAVVYSTCNPDVTFDALFEPLLALATH